MPDNRARKKKLSPITFGALAESPARVDVFILLFTCFFGLTDRSSCGPLDHVVTASAGCYTSDRSRTVTQLRNCSETRWEEGKVT